MGWISIHKRAIAEGRAFQRLEVDEFLFWVTRKMNFAPGDPSGVSPVWVIPPRENPANGSQDPLFETEGPARGRLSIPRNLTTASLREWTWNFSYTRLR